MTHLYSVQDENSQDVMDIEAGDIIHACEILGEQFDTKEDFQLSAESLETESAYNGEYRLHRK